MLFRPLMGWRVRTNVTNGRHTSSYLCTFELELRDGRMDRPRIFWGINVDIWNRGTGSVQTTDLWHNRVYNRRPQRCATAHYTRLELDTPGITSFTASCVFEQKQLTAFLLRLRYKIREYSLLTDIGDQRTATDHLRKHAVT